MRCEEWKSSFGYRNWFDWLENVKLKFIEFLCVVYYGVLEI